VVGGSQSHGSRLVSAVGGSQQHGSNVRGVVIGLGLRKRVPAQGLITWGGCSTCEIFVVPKEG